MKSERSTADLFIKICAKSGIKVTRVVPADMVRPAKRRAKATSPNGKPRTARRLR